ADVRSIPREIRLLARDERRLIRNFSEWSKSKGNSEACLVWFAGDRLLEGNARGLLKALHPQNRRTFVVVNTPCLEEIPFLTVQPRIFANSASTDCWNSRIRIESDAKPSTRNVIDFSQSVEPWAKLTDAISLEKATPGAGVEPLLGLWESR